MCAPGCHSGSLVPSGAARMSWTTSASSATRRRSTTSMALRLTADGEFGQLLIAAEVHQRRQEVGQDDPGRVDEQVRTGRAVEPWRRFAGVRLENARQRGPLGPDCSRPHPWRARAAGEEAR